MRFPGITSCHFGINSHFVFKKLANSNASRRKRAKTVISSRQLYIGKINISD